MSWPAVILDEIAKSVDYGLTESSTPLPVGPKFLRITDTIRLPVPPIGLQQQFAEQVEAIRAAEDLQRIHLEQLDSLFASLQHRAFAGEL